jgi:hypothetical protein
MKKEGFTVAVKTIVSVAMAAFAVGAAIWLQKRKKNRK